VSFARAVAFTLDQEGDWSDDELGGKTRYGISSVYHPTVNLDTLTPEGAARIYKTEYWDRIQGDSLVGTVPEVAFSLYETAVNPGVGASIKLAQRALRVKEDGILGPITWGRLMQSDLRFVLEHQALCLFYWMARPGWAVNKGGWSRRGFARVIEAARLEMTT